MRRADAERWAYRLWARQVGDLEEDLRAFLHTLPDHHVLPYTIGLLLCAKDAGAKAPYLRAIFNKGNELEAAKKHAPAGSWEAWAFVHGVMFPIDPILDDDESREERGRRASITEAWKKRTGHGRFEWEGLVYWGHHPSYDVLALHEANGHQFPV